IDSARVIAFHERIKSEFKDNLAQKATVKASQVRSEGFAPSLLIDGNYDSYWSVADDCKEASFTLDFKTKKSVNRLMLQEYISLGQRVKEFVVSYKKGNKWVPLKLNEETTTIGYKRLLRFETVSTRAVRVTFKASRGPVCISEVGAYYVP
ncbi:MAG: discoidin domain-containing protein, partial [Bacteroidaceae bacterium]